MKPLKIIAESLDLELMKKGKTYKLWNGYFTIYESTKQEDIAKHLAGIIMRKFPKNVQHGFSDTYRGVA